MLQQLLFIIITGFALWWASRRFVAIRQNILLGRDEKIEGDVPQRLKNVALIAFGQQKMFKKWIPAVLHFFIYAAFVVTQVELIEIFIDGVFGQHRFFAPFLGGFYTFVISFIEILSVLAFVATVIFLVRRNILKLNRLHKPEMKGWPTRDANLILLFEIVLLIGIFSMNGADKVLQSMGADHYPLTGNFAVSTWLGPALFGGLSEGTLIGIERFGWWLHLSMVLIFLNYLPYSKHLHIILAFPNTFFSKLSPKGQMDNMPVIMNEVKSMMGLEGATSGMDEGEMPVFGANDVTSLSWKNVMDAYSCTECGRCTEACPANITGKKLSPRKIMMDVRDRADEIGKKIASKDAAFISADKVGDGVVLDKTTFNDDRNLFDYITREEIHACTTCNACVEACPVTINPLDIILQLRRYELLTESSGPSDWLPMFTSIENSGAAWAIPDDRDKWAQDAMQ